jgi:hypothetical protein
MNNRKGGVIDRDPAEVLARDADVRVEIVNVTSAMARGWLSRNVENQRNKRRLVIEDYARDMAADRWQLTGDPIKITPDGNLIDGQMRCQAILQAIEQNPELKSVRIAVAFNVPPAAMKVIDIGARRSVADALRMEEATNRNHLGTILRRAFTWEQGNLADMRNSAFYPRPTLSELVEFFRQSRNEFIAATDRGMDVRDQGVDRASAAGTAYFVLRRLDDNEAKTFFEGMVTGAIGTPTSPILVLRNRLIRARGDDRADALDLTERLYFYMVAWNAFRADEPIDRNRLMLPRGGINNANFVRPI